MIKATFSASLLQSSVSHGSSEIILICWFAQETFLYYYQYLKQLSTFFLWWRFFGWTERSKDQLVSEIKSFCSIIHYTIYFGGGGGGEKLLKLILLFSKDALNWSNVMIKTFIMLQNIYISDTCCSSILSIHQRNLNYSAVFNNNNKCFLNYHVTGVMIIINSALKSQK